jgi:hypothetical protein
MMSETTLLDSFRSIKRSRKPKVIGDTEPFQSASRQQSAPKIPFQSVREDPAVEKCRGVAEWRVKAPPVANVPGVLYATFYSLDEALQYSESLRHVPVAKKRQPARKRAKKADTPLETPVETPPNTQLETPGERFISNVGDVSGVLDSIVSMDVNLVGDDDMHILFSSVVDNDSATLECDDSVPIAETDEYNYTKQHVMPSPLLLPQAFLDAVKSDNMLHSTPRNIKTVLDPNPPFKMYNVKTTRKIKTDRFLVRKTLFQAQSGDNITPFSYPPTKFRFSPQLSPKKDSPSTPPRADKRKRTPKKTTPNAAEKRVAVTREAQKEHPKEPKKAVITSLSERFVGYGIIEQVWQQPPPATAHVSDLFN